LALLLALNQRAVSVDELSGFARVMRQKLRLFLAQDEPRPTDLSIRAHGGDEPARSTYHRLGDCSRRRRVLRCQAWQPFRQLPQRLTDVLEALA